jgi:hypothetical protein
MPEVCKDLAGFIVTRVFFVFINWSIAGTFRKSATIIKTIPRI